MGFKCGWEKCNRDARVYLGTAGWRVSCGENWGWRRSGRSVSLKGAHRFGGKKYCSCWSSTGWSRRVASFTCTGIGFYQARWMSCWRRTSRLPTKIDCIVVWDRILEHKQDLFAFLKKKWADLFKADFEVLLYDLTSTYFEGEMEQNPKAKRGYSRDGRPDCPQLVIALVVTPDGFPLAYEVLNGNTADCSTLCDFFQKKENTNGNAGRVGGRDGGVQPT